MITILIVAGMGITEVGCGGHRIIVLHDPLSAEAHNTLGVRYLEEGQWKAAERALRRAIRKRPDWVAPYLNLGLLHARMGVWSKAFKDYARALSVAHGHCPDCWNNLAWAGLQNGRNPKDLIGWVRIALRQQGDPVFEYYHTGVQIALRAKDCELAQSWLQGAALQSNLQEIPEFYKLLARYRKQCGSTSGPSNPPQADHPSSSSHP